MVTKAKKFTPEVLLSAPRRSAGVPNPSGTLVAYTVSTYSFEEHKKSTSLEILVIATYETHILSEGRDISGINWLGDDELVFLDAKSDGTTQICHHKLALEAGGAAEKEYVIGDIQSAASDLKIKAIGSNTYAVIFATQIYRTGGPRTFRSSGKLYSGLFVRHWDRYEDQARNTLIYGQISKDNSGKLELSRLTDVLKDTVLESPIRPFGGEDCFDISHNRIIFSAKDPALNPALNTKVNVYLMTIKSWTEPPSAPEPLYVAGYEGAITSPVFSQDGAKAAFLAMKKNGYEADKNRIFVVSDVKIANSKASTTIIEYAEDSFWDRSPSSIIWTHDGSALLAIAEDKGYVKLFHLPLSPNGIIQPSVVTSTAAVSSAVPLANGKVLVSGSSLIDNSLYAMFDLANYQSRGTVAHIWRHSNSSKGNRFGLSPEQISSIWTPASNPTINKEVHSWVVKPSYYEDGRKYPVAYLIHGGPQGSWADSWSTRWNAAVFAEQGFIVIAVNPTGSTGYGQAYTDAIQDNWGGDPYQDIVNAFEWASKNMPEADHEQAVALGASYGGYMMNWIQGHDLGRKFKALVCHDGIFSTANLLSTEELYFPFHDLGGAPFKLHNRQEDTLLAHFNARTYSAWRKWDPSEHLDSWKTPELVIHSSKDYRIPISEGLAAFNVLQARGIDSQFLTFPDENHWVLKPENSLVWHKVVLNFINKSVGLQAYTTDSPDDAEFFGGIRTEDADGNAEMPAAGKPET